MGLAVVRFPPISKDPFTFHTRKKQIVKIDHYRPLRPVQIILPKTDAFQELAASFAGYVDEGDVKRQFGNRVRMYALPPRDGRAPAVSFYPPLTDGDLPVIQKLISEYQERSRQRGPLHAPLRTNRLASVV